MVTLEKRERKRERSTGKGKIPEIGKGVEREMIRIRGRVKGNGVKRGKSWSLTEIIFELAQRSEASFDCLADIEVR